MVINIFANPIAVKIGDQQFQYDMLTKDNNETRFREFLEKNVSETCGLIHLYCSTNNCLDTILDVISYAHRIRATVTVFTYDMVNLKKRDDQTKINDYIEYNVNIVF